MSRVEVRRAVLESTAAEGAPSSESSDALLRFLGRADVVDMGTIPFRSCPPSASYHFC
jgi:hypothetical protein